MLFQIYSKIHVLAAQFVPLRIAEEDKIKRTSLGSTVPLSLLFRTKNVLLFSLQRNFYQNKNFSNMYYKIPSRLFSM